MVKDYVRIEEVLDRLYRNPLCVDVTLESVVDYLIDFFRLVGVPSMFDERVFEGEIKEYRCKLPDDFYEEIMVLMKESREREFVPARASSDAFPDYRESGLKPPAAYTFVVNNLYLFASLQKGRVKMNYRAIATDDKGFPLLPGDRFFMHAFEGYVKMKYYQLLWENGKLPDKVLQQVQQDYSWAVGKLEISTKMPTLSQMESLANSFTNLIPRENEFKHRFQNLGAREQIKIKP
jgi:hypothetical protein